MPEQTIHIRSAGREITFKMNLDPAFPADRHIINHTANGVPYEPEIAWLLMRALRPGDFAIDVGANVGFFTLMMAQLVGKTGHVLTVEPGADNFAKLDANLRLNETGSLVTIDQRVLSDREEIVKFYLSADDSGGHALWPPSRWPDNVKTQKQGDTVLERQAVKLDALVMADASTRLIKIDVEGAEEKILRGAWGTLLSHEPAFIVAEHNWFGMEQMGATTEKLRSLMRQQGYSTWLLMNDDSVPRLVPAGSKLKPPRIINILFATEDAVAEAWPEITQ